MAVKQDLAKIVGLATYMAGLLAIRDKTIFQVIDLPDFDIEVTPAMKQEWLRRYNEAKTQLQTLAAGL